MILERIRLAYPSLTKSQKRLADYLASQYQEAAFLTASRMAQAMSMNQATVIRFAQRLGYEGFPEMIADVQELVHQELQSRGDGDGPVSPFEATGTRLAEGIHRLFSHISPEASEAALEMLVKAESVCVVGEGTSAALAELFAAHLRQIGKRAVALNSSTRELAVGLQSMLPGSLLVAISLDHHAPEIARAIVVAHEIDIPALALSWSPLDPSAQAADIALICPPQEDDTLPSLTAFCLMLDTLLQMIVEHDPIDATLAQQRIRRYDRQMRRG